MSSSSEPPYLDDETLQRIYTWVDEIPLSRPKRNIARDFSDGVLMAEVINHYFPKLVEMHNYSPANSFHKKMYNWATLNSKVFKKLKFNVSKEEMESVVNCKPGMIESLLLRLQNKMAEYRAEQARKRMNRSSDRSSVGSNNRTNTPQRSPHYANASPDKRRQNGHSLDTAIGQQPHSSRHGEYGNEMEAPYESNAYHHHQRGVPGPESYSSSDIPAHIQQQLIEKDERISNLEETKEFLELKISKLQQLLDLKDSRIQTLTTRLQSQPGQSQS
eukprot:gb/GECG01004975.1/.p1 GENE.gb/GECG01004975.1/~~gb/GECG01004975.1/.p1  ORF type:complete len:274 (+),score=39.53 gb/GECG01004975.1/:1-822(+)